MKKLFITLVALMLTSSAFANTKNYEIDATHSIVSFKIGHLIGKVRGSFSDFSGEINYDENKIKKFNTNATINVASIDTNNTKRDAHLKNADFFDIDNKKHPEFQTINFEAKSFQTASSSAGGIHKGKLNGYITIHGVKKPITLDASINGDPILDPFGNARIGISATGSLNRQDFGLTWKHPAGEIVVGDVVEIELEIQGTRKVKMPKKKNKK